MDKLALRNVILIGIRGTGKTTVGRLLAERANFNFADADDRVEAVTGKTIAEIFATEGEPSFRDRESAALAELCARPTMVIATGGGAVMRPANRDILRASGFVVWLQVSPEIAWARMERDPATRARRPNLTATGGELEVRSLLATREPFYRELADFTIASDTLSPESVADAIFTAWTGGTICRSSSGACGSSPSG